MARRNNELRLKVEMRILTTGPFIRSGQSYQMNTWLCRHVQALTEKSKLITYREFYDENASTQKY